MSIWWYTIWCTLYYVKIYVESTKLKTWANLYLAGLVWDLFNNEEDVEWECVLVVSLAISISKGKMFVWHLKLPSKLKPEDIMQQSSYMLIIYLQLSDAKLF